ncbi:MAG TPA: NifU family protein, partial [Sedimentisphaerales bacterium]|nr:NifU family protein [Sedimentisphaerales bacterium]
EIEKIIERIQGAKVKLASARPVKPAKLTNIQKIQLVQETINSQIRPMLRADGGDIELIDIDGNKVLVALRGMCAQCKVAEFTLKDVVQAKLREFVSDQIVVEEVKESNV